MRMHGIGLRRCQVQLTHLLAHISRHELDSHSHFGHHALRFRDAIQAYLAEAFLLGNGADGIDLVLDILCNQLAVAADTAIQVDEMIGVADGTNALAYLFSLLREALALLASCCHLLLGLLQAQCYLWRPTRTTPPRLGVGIVEVLLHPVERLFSGRCRLRGGPLFGGHRGRDGLAQLMLHMKKVRRVLHPEVLFNIGQEPGCLVARRLNDAALQRSQGVPHQFAPGVVIPGLGGLLQQDIVAGTPRPADGGSA
jgi:hypothetical protein